MIKGCNKRVIVMKDTGNAMIEEAFFILKPEAARGGVCEGDIIKQANRILEKSVGNEELHLFSSSACQSKTGRFAHFLSGMLMGTALTAAIFLIL